MQLIFLKSLSEQKSLKHILMTRSECAIEIEKRKQIDKGNQSSLLLEFPKLR